MPVIRIGLKVAVELELMEVFPFGCEMCTKTPCSLFTNGEPGLGQGPLQEVPRATGACRKTQALPLCHFCGCHTR